MINLISAILQKTNILIMVGQNIQSNTGISQDIHNDKAFYLITRSSSMSLSSVSWDHTESIV
jgi:hypothetical protein